MRRVVLVLLLAPALAGCLTPAEPAQLAGAPPVTPFVEAPGGLVEVVGDATRVTWQGTADPFARPAVDPRWTLPVVAQVLARHELTLPADATVVEGGLAWDAAGSVGFQLVNETGAVWCGGSGDAGARCVGTLHKPRDGPTPWAVRVTGSPGDSPPLAFDYTVTLLVRAVPLASLGPPVAPSALRFGEPVAVYDEARAAEPSLAVTPAGRVYVAALPHANHVWASDDGLSFRRVEVTELPYCALGQVSRLPPTSLQVLQGPALTHFGCGDIDVATSGEDTVWFSAHWGNEAVSVSQDRGATWTTNVLAAGADAHTDRQWLVTDGPRTGWQVQTSVLTRAATSPTPAPTPFTVAKTLDGGRTWLPLGRASFAAQCVSTLARDPAGTLYLGSCDARGPGVAVSEDGGLTWTWRPGPARDGLGFLIVQATTDAANNVYLVWTEPPADGNGSTVWFASSGDRGASWSGPRAVFSQPGTFVLPWATGGAAGRLAVAAYATRWVGEPMEALGAWYPVVAVTQDALAPEPSWSEATVGTEPIQRGPICLGGNACSHGRNLADYFQVQADGAGRVHIAYAAADPIDGLRPGVWYAVQAEGPALGGPSVDKNGGT